MRYPHPFIVCSVVTKETRRDLRSKKKSDDKSFCSLGLFPAQGKSLPRQRRMTKSSRKCMLPKTEAKTRYRLPATAPWKKRKKDISDAIREKSLLRFVTTGSVTTASPAIGRLLYETKSIYEISMKRLKNVQEKKLRKLIWPTSWNGWPRNANRDTICGLPLFRDGKKKVYNYDSPGHVHSTRNMVTGAPRRIAPLFSSTTNGVLTQSKSTVFDFGIANRI